MTDPLVADKLKRNLNGKVEQLIISMCYWESGFCRSSSLKLYCPRRVVDVA